MSESGPGRPDSSTAAGGKEFSCGVCNRIFNTEFGLKQHRRAEHPESEPENKLRDFEWLWQQRWVRGRSEYDIAEEIGCTRPAVGYWLKKYNIGGRVHPWVLDAEILHDLYIRRDNKMHDLANMLNVDRSTLAKYATKHDANKDVHRGGDGLKWAIPYIRDEYEKGRSVKSIGEDLGATYYGILRVMDMWGVERRKPGNLSGEEHPQWSGGVVDYYGPNWFTQRNRARGRDNYTCQRCGVNESEQSMQLDVHHKTPRSHYVDGGGEVDYEEMNRIENLITLCRSCHKTMERWPIQPN